MSVMSAAEARQAAGASPQLPSRRLRIATPAGGPDDAGRAGSPAGAAEEVLRAAEEEAAEREAAGLNASALHVTQVRVVREVSVRTLRAAATRGGTAAPARLASQAQSASQAQTASHAQTTSHAQTASHAQTTSQTRAASQTRVTSQTRAAGQARTASRVQFATHTRMTSQARVTTRIRQIRPGPVRLTRRGRRVVAAFAVLVVAVTATLLWMAAAGSVQASSHPPALGSPYRGMTQVVVRPGQTLWSLAAAAEPSANPWAVMQQIIQVNALSGAQVQAGEQLWIPKA